MPEPGDQLQSPPHYSELVLHHLQDFVVVSDLDGVPIFVNESASSLTGRSIENLKGTSPELWFVPEERDHVRSVVYPLALKSGRWMGELNFLQFESGNRVPVFFEVYRLDDPSTGRPRNLASMARDLSAQKAREAELREAHQRIQSVLSATEVATWVYEIASDEVVADSNLKKLFSVSEDDANGGCLATYLKAIHPDDRERVAATISQAITGNLPFVSEYRIIQADGSTRWVLARGSVNLNETGCAVSLPGVLLDITDKVRAEEKRSELSHELARQARTVEVMVSAIPDFTYIFDRGGRFVFANKPLLDLLGIRLCDIVGRNFFELGYPAELARKLHDQIEEVFQTQCPLTDRTPFTGVNGTPGFYEYIFTPVMEPDGTVELVAGCTRDITKDQNAFEALQRSERNFRSLAETLPDTVWVAGPGGEMEWTNSVLPKITGRTLEEIRGSGYPSLIHPEDLKNTLAVWESALASAKAFEMQHRIRQADGGWRWHLVRGAPKLGIGGEVEKWIGTSTDVHEQKRLAEERDELLASERAARNLAEHTGKMKDEFLATLSHELRTPLNAIFGWTQILRDEEGVDAQTLAEAVEVIDRNVRMQTQLIEDLLDMSRIISGKLRLDVQQIDPARCIEAAIETVLPAANAKEIRIQKIFDAGAGPISGDAGRIQQIVWNLLSNAIKFTPREGTVQVILERVNSHVEISVIDSGKGIAPEFLPLVFERFRQEDSRINRQHGGLGIGLAIVKQLTELHGGHVRVRSGGFEKGAAFTVHLPLKAVLHFEEPEERRHPAAASALLPARWKRTALTGLRVLVVDDEQDARHLLKRMLEDCGAQVSLAASGAEALHYYRTARPDVMVSDIGMPVMDGYELLRKIRALPETGEVRVPAVALTAFARSDDRTKALLAGFSAHVSKPVEPSELVATLASVAGIMP